MEERLLKSPPVRQAIVEFRLVHANDPSVEALGVVQEEFSTDFPHREWLMQGEVTVTVEAGALRATEAPSIRHGVKFTSQDQSRVVAFTPTSFVYNRVQAYENRDKYLPEVRSAYSQYLAALPDTGVASEISRIGDRFINEIVLDAGDGGVDLDDYFVGTPKPVSDDPLVGFRVDRQTASAQTGIGTRVQLFNAPPSPDGDSVAFILDVDVWNEGQRPSLWNDGLDEVINQLFDVRRSLFFRSVHERALVRYI